MRYLIAKYPYAVGHCPDNIVPVASFFWAPIPDSNAIDSRVPLWHLTGAKRTHNPNFIRAARNTRDRIAQYCTMHVEWMLVMLMASSQLYMFGHVLHAGSAWHVTSFRLRRVDIDINAAVWHFDMLISSSSPSSSYYHHIIIIIISSPPSSYHHIISIIPSSSYHHHYHHIITILYYTILYYIILYYTIQFRFTCRSST